jgi:hypothetical protein
LDVVRVAAHGGDRFQPSAMKSGPLLLRMRENAIKSRMARRVGRS